MTGGDLSRSGPIIVWAGTCAALLACGNVLPLAAQVAEMRGATLLGCPLWDNGSETWQATAEIICRYDRVVVGEGRLAAEGGGGSFVRDCLEEHPALRTRFRCKALDSSVCGQIASVDKLRALGGLALEAVCQELD